MVKKKKKKSNTLLSGSLVEKHPLLQKELLVCPSRTGEVPKENQMICPEEGEVLGCRRDPMSTAHVQQVGHSLGRGVFVPGASLTCKPSEPCSPGGCFFFQEKEHKGHGPCHVETCRIVKGTEQKGPLLSGIKPRPINFLE